ncbi:unnamed protein product [Discula destructiva]
MVRALLEASTCLEAPEAHPHFVPDRSFSNGDTRDAYRRSVLKRLSGDVDESERIIEECLRQHIPDTQSAMFAALCLSQANNHIYRFNFEEAHSQLQKWRPKFIASQEQDELLLDQILCAGRALRGQGDFESARTLIEACWKRPHLPHHKRFIVGSLLADVYCELAMARTDGKISVDLARIQVWIHSQLEFIRSSGRYHKGYRRLMLSLIEIEILNGNHDTVRDLTSELLNLYDGLANCDITDQLGHIRALIALARVSWTQHNIFERWKAVIDWGIFYNPQELDVFSCGVVYLFLTSVSSMKGMSDASLRYGARAWCILEQKRPQYLIPGIGTYLLRQAWDLYEQCHQPPLCHS